MRILLIEDDEILMARLTDALTSQRYLVDAVETGLLGWEYAQDSGYDLIVTDVGLPELDGITLCQRLRNQGCTIPVLLMTARDAPDERIRGLDAGADDHLTKPLNLAEFLARVRALLRRGEVAAETILTAGLLQLDPMSCQVTYGDRPLKLTPKEYSLLELFLRNPERVFSRAHIINHLWSFDDPPLEDSVKAHIKGLRRKLKQVGAADWIANVYGIGYRFSLPTETELIASGAEVLNGEASTDAEAAIQSQTVIAPLSSQQFVLPTETNPKFAVKPWADEPQTSSPKTPQETQAFASKTSDDTELEQRFQQSIETLWQKYQGAIAARLDLLQQAAAAIQLETLSPTLQTDAARAAHKLAGVLGMFERDQGTAVARQIETVLTNDNRDGTSVTVFDHRITEIPDLVDQLATLLDLPVTPNLQDHVSSKHPSGLAPSDSTSVGTLMLVSDDSTLLSALQAIAATSSLTWIQITTIAQARAKIQAQQPELVVVDVASASQLQDSLDLLQHLAASTLPIPTLALTCLDSLSDRVAIAQTGIQRILVKPVIASQLAVAAQQVLQHSRILATRVLVVDDDPLVINALRPLLEPWGIALTGLEDPQRFWEVLQTTHPDLLILDVEMPQFSGIDLCQAVRTDPDWQNLPILFLTAHRDVDTVQRVYRAGADDYIAKPIVGPELLTRLLNRLERHRLWQTYAHRDRLTGLPNTHASQQQLNQRLEMAKTTQTPLALALMQLTDLHPINFHYGHDAGNLILHTWGQCFQTLPQGTAVIGYWGNGEFVVGLPDLDRAAAQDYLEPLCQRLRRQIITLPTEERIQPVFIYTVVDYPSNGQTLQALYQTATTQLKATFLSEHDS
ncbi:MAG: response regulator [Cyanobacteria bacterium J06635_15]